MDTLQIKKMLNGREEGTIGEERIRHASVLIPLIPEKDGSLSVLFQVRSSKLPEQPGDICFPGGSAEPGERPEETAVRETAEELLIHPDTIELMGASDQLNTGVLRVHCFAGILRDYSFSFSHEEVEEVFTVPLEWLLQAEPSRYVMDWSPVFPEGFPFEKIYGGREYAWRDRKDTVLFYEYGERVIWGMTAKMLEAFLRIIRYQKN